MTPSHATKSRRRYRYYVTRPDQLDGSRAWRVSAHDLEQLVCTSIAERLLDPLLAAGLAAPDSLAAEQLRAARAPSDLHAATLRNGSAKARADLLDRLVARIQLQEDRVVVELNPHGVAEGINVRSFAEAGEPLHLIITTPAVRVRRGHQLRLIIPESDDASRKPERRDDRLVALVAEAHQARQLVSANPDKSIASIAREQGRCRTRLGKLVGLSCLAPDIVTAIVEGRQPEHLTVTRLTSAPLPFAWTDQRREFGFS